MAYRQSDGISRTQLHARASLKSAFKYDFKHATYLHLHLSSVLDLDPDFVADRYGHFDAWEYSSMAASSPGSRRSHDGPHPASNIALIALCMLALKASFPLLLLVHTSRCFKLYQLAPRVSKPRAPDPAAWLHHPAQVDMGDPLLLHAVRPAAHGSLVGARRIHSSQEVFKAALIHACDKKSEEHQHEEHLISAHHLAPPRTPPRPPSVFIPDHCNLNPAHPPPE